VTSRRPSALTQLWLLTVFVSLAACGEPRAQVADWVLAPGETLSPDTVEVDVLVTERTCGEGFATGRIEEPEIEYAEDAVTVIIRVVPLQESGFAACPQGLATLFTIELDEPLGDRDLVQREEDQA
jgi:hypothetical protein